MKVLEQFYDSETAENVVREIEYPDDHFEINARIAAEINSRISDHAELQRLRTSLMDRILTGESLTQAEREEFRRLCERQNR